MRTGSVLNMTVLFLRLIHKSLIGFICRAGLRSTGRSLPPWARPTPSAPSCHPSSSGNPASASRVWPERFARLCPAPPPGVFWSLFHTRYCTTRHTYTLSKVLVASILSHLGTTHPLELGSALQEVLDSSLATVGTLSASKGTVIASVISGNGEHREHHMRDKTMQGWRLQRH